MRFACATVAFIAAVLRQGGWRGAAWLLERTAPEQYGRPGDRPASDGDLSDLFAEFAVVSDDDAPE